MTVLKKKASSAAAEAFEEFEEDIIEEEDIESDTPPSSTPASASLSPADASLAKYESFTRSLNAVYALSAFALRSALPSIKLLQGLIDATAPERLDDTLEMIAKWRGKGLPLGGDQMRSLVGRCISARRASAMVMVLKDKSKYGIEISEIRQVDAVFRNLSAFPKETDEVVEGEKERLVEEIYTLLELTRLYVPESTPDAAGEIAALSLSVRGGEVDSERVTKLVKNLRGMGSEGLVEFVMSLSSKRRDWVTSRVKVVAGELEKAGQADNALWFAGIYSSLV